MPAYFQSSRRKLYGQTVHDHRWMEREEGGRGLRDVAKGILALLLVFSLMEVLFWPLGLAFETLLVVLEILLLTQPVLTIVSPQRASRVEKFARKSRYRLRKLVAGTRERKLVVILFIVFVVAGAIAGYLAYSLVSYKTASTELLLFTRTNSSGTFVAYVNTYFSADGPISAGQPITLAGLQVSGSVPANVDHISFLLILGFPFINVNQSVVPAPAYSIYSFWVNQSTTLFEAGTYNMSGYLVFWSRGQPIDFGYAVQTTTGRQIVVQDPAVWSQYEYLRLTTWVAVASIVFAAVPTGLRQLKDFVQPKG